MTAAAGRLNRRDWLAARPGSAACYACGGIHIGGVNPQSVAMAMRARRRGD
jgi:hypothetical protein